MPKNPWMQASFDLWSLGLEASSVIAMRTMMMASGGAAAETEVRRMVSEKIASGMALQALAMSGGLGNTLESATTKTLAHYRRKVRANQRRLTKD